MESSYPEWINTYIEQVPADVMIRGMFFRWVDDFCEQQGVAFTRKKTIDFKMYPVREYLHHLIDSVKPLADTSGYKMVFREMGQSFFPSFKSTLLGRSIFAGSLDLSMIFKVAPRAYKILQNEAMLKIEHKGANTALIHFRNVWVFNEYIGLGTWEGVLNHHTDRGSVTVLPSNDSKTTVLQLQW